MSNQERCGAWCHGRKKRCTQYPVAGKTRCKWHGGFSTGQTTPEGRRRTAEARQEGFQRWLRRLKLFGIKRPQGRRPGARWITANMWRKWFEAAYSLSPEEAAILAQELVDTRRLAEADAKLAELVRRTEASLNALSEIKREEIK